MVKPGVINTRKLGRDGRPQDDNYPTLPECTRTLMAMEQFPGRIWEPFAGAGVMKRTLEEAMLEVAATTLVEYPEGAGVIPGVDFQIEARAGRVPAGCKSLVTNPAYYLVDTTEGKIVADMLDLPGIDKVCLLMQTSFLESMNRWKNVFRDRAPKRIYSFINRVTLIPHRLWLGRTDPEFDQGSIAFSWFVWEKPYRPPPSHLYFVDSREYQREHDLERYQVSAPNHKGALHPRLI